MMMTPATRVLLLEDSAPDARRIKDALDPRVLMRALRHAVERHRVEQALRQSEERYQLAFQGANDGLWDWDLRTNTIHYSTRWKGMLGLAEDDIGNAPREWFDRVHA